MKPINPKIHGVLDYVFAAFLFLAPLLFGFGGTPAVLCYVISMAHLGLSLTTAYPLGVFRYIPFTLHAKIELGAALFLMIAPWLFGFSVLTTARNLYVILGIVVVGLWSLTDYRSAASGQIGSIENFTTRERRKRAA